MLQSSTPSLLASSPSSLSPLSSPGSTITINAAAEAPSSASSGSSSSTIRHESPPPASSPRSFTVNRQPRKALSVSVASGNVAGGSKSYWSPPISSPLASPYGSPPSSPELPPALVAAPSAEPQQTLKKRSRPTSPSHSAASAAGPSARPPRTETPRASHSTVTSPVTSSATLLRIRPGVRRAASANSLGALESAGWAAGDKIARLSGQGSRPAASSRASPDAVQGEGEVARTAGREPLRTLSSLANSGRLLPLQPAGSSAASSSPSSSSSSASPTSPSQLLLANSGAMTSLLPSVSTSKVSSLTSSSSAAPFEDYFSPSRGTHHSTFALLLPRDAKRGWPEQEHNEGTASPPRASYSRLTIRIDDVPTRDGRNLPELDDDRSPTTPVASSAATSSTGARSTTPAASPALSSRLPRTADTTRSSLPTPPRLFRKRSSSDPTPAAFSADDLNAVHPLLFGKPLPPLPVAEDNAFRSSSTSSCSSAASNTSRITEDTAATCSSAATTTETCNTPDSVQGLMFNPHETVKARRRSSKRAARVAVGGSAVETDSEGEQEDVGSVATGSSLDSPFEDRSVVEALPAPPPHVSHLGIQTNAALINTEKASKLACQLWDLVEGEVAYTDDLVTLVQIYLHHLFMLPTFTVERRDAVARNTLDLLFLHKRFTQSLVTIASHERLRSPEDKDAPKLSDADLDRATRRIARVFVDEASEFAAYQEYCTGHEDALAVIRQHELTLQWMEYEKKCSELSEQRPRTSVTGMMEGLCFSPVSGSRRASFKWHSPPPSNSKPDASAPPPDPDRKQSRLMLRDLLIKPIQRICRYPLILDSMRTTKVLDAVSGEQRPAGGSDLEEALDVMRVVAGGVDEATRKKISLERSRVIRNRIEGHPALSRGVLSALGECLLVGSLDVIYFHPVHAPLSTPIKIRYLSAFLYSGYFVLCKAKKFKSYTPLHFLPLDRIEILDGQPGKSYLADSIRLQGEGFFLEVSAACAKEKDIWLSHLRTAQASPTLALKSPPSSAPEIFSSRTISRRMSHGASLSAKGSLPLKRSSIVNGSAVVDGEASQSSPVEPYASPLSSASTPATSPRATTVGALLPAVPSQMLFLRSPASYREAVDKALADVMSETCSTARNNALRQGVVLFAPSAHKTTTSSSTIGAAVSSVRRKMAHQNGSMRRRSSFLEGNSGGQVVLVEGLATSNKAHPPISSSIKLPRTKSEVGLKRESFLRRSSIMTHWPPEPKATPAVPSLPSAKSPSRAKSDKARSRTAPPTPTMPSVAVLPQAPPPPPPSELSSSPTEVESPIASAAMLSRSVPSFAFTPIQPSPTKSVKERPTAPGSVSRSVVDAWLPRPSLGQVSKPLSPILSPAVVDEEVAFPRRSDELPPAQVPAPIPIPGPARAPKTSILRRSLTSTFSRRKTQSTPDVPELGAVAAQLKLSPGSTSADGLAALAPVSPVSPLEICGEFGSISAREAAAAPTSPKTVTAPLPTLGGTQQTRPSFFLKSRSSSFASDDSSGDAPASAPPMSPSVSSCSAPSSDDGQDPPAAGPVRRKSSRSVRFLKSFNFTPVN